MRINYLIFSLVALTGCAGSANHKVVQTNPATDQALSCQQADAEIARAQAIINEVNDDKADISGADVMDGILYFPFNLIVKNSNYSNALTAANQRIISLKEIKNQKDCTDGALHQVADNTLTSRMSELNKMHSEGLISEEEYKSMKLKLLGL